MSDRVASGGRPAGVKIRDGVAHVAAWKSEPIAADDPFARFAAMAQTILVRRMIAANRTHWRKYDERIAQKRQARELARENPRYNTGAARTSAPVAAPDNFSRDNATR